MQGVILAGGKGTRLVSISNDLPKPLVTIAGKPVIVHQIKYLKRNNITDLIILLGFKGNIIQGALGDGSNFGVNITYSHEDRPLGTAGAVKNAESHIKDRIFVLYGDVILDVNFSRMCDFHLRHQSKATIAVHPNSHPFDSDLLVMDEHDRVISFLPKPRTDSGYVQNCVNAGLYILDKEVINELPDTFSDFGKDIFPKLAKKGFPIYGYTTPEYIKDMGTTERFTSVEQDIISCKVTRRNLNQKQKAIFLDRDGVINVEKDLIYKTEDIEILNGVPAAINQINKSDYLCIVVTNQPAVARGLCDEKQVRTLHNCIDTIIGLEGAFIDRYYYCPHHPDSGFEGENKFYKISCNCRNRIQE